MAAQTLAIQAKTVQHQRRKRLHDAINNLPDRDGLPWESAKQLQKYLMAKDFKGKPKLKDLDTRARAYFEKMLEWEMKDGWKKEIARLEVLERELEEEQVFQEQGLGNMEEGDEEMDIDDVKEMVDDREDEENDHEGFETALGQGGESLSLAVRLKN